MYVNMDEKEYKKLQLERTASGNHFAGRRISLKTATREPALNRLSNMSVMLILLLKLS